MDDEGTCPSLDDFVDQRGEPGLLEVSAVKHGLTLPGARELGRRRNLAL
jgi:hypothetical protein